VKALLSLPSISKQRIVVGILYQDHPTGDRSVRVEESVLGKRVVVVEALV
jgi:hypothetical protein